MTHVDRLKAFMQYTSIPISQFADFAQIPRPTLSQILGGRNKKINNELLQKLHNAFPNLNISWLLFGDGPMTLEGVAAPDFSNLVENPDEADSDDEENLTMTENKKNEVQQPQQQFCFPSSAEQADEEMTFSPDNTKKIKSIIVFYTDNSFETFNPAR